MGLDRILKRVAALKVTPSLLQNRHENARIQAEITAINELMGKKVDGLLMIFKGRSKGRLAAEQIEPALIAMLPDNLDQLTSLYEKITNIDNITKRIQSVGCGYFAMLHTAIFKKLHAATNPSLSHSVHPDILQLSEYKDFCDANLDALNQQIVDRLKRESLYCTLEDYIKAHVDDAQGTESRPEFNARIIKDYYTSLNAIAKRFAEINPHFNHLFMQHSFFTQVPDVLFNTDLLAYERVGNFQQAMRGFIENNFPIDILGLDTVNIADDNDRLFLVKMNALCETLLQNVEKEINKKLKADGLYLTYDEYCLQSPLARNNETVEERASRLVNSYYLDRNRKIEALASVDSHFNDLNSQHKEIVRLQSTLFDGNYSNVERRANFGRHLNNKLNVITKVDVATDDNQSAIMLFLKGVAVLFAALVTAPLFGVGGYLAYKGLFKTTGSEFARDALHYKNEFDKAEMTHSDEGSSLIGLQSRVSSSS